MIILTDTSIRSSLVNASRKEKSDLTLPDGFDAIDFDVLDYLGWRDPQNGPTRLRDCPDTRRGDHRSFARSSGGHSAVARPVLLVP
ncbi:FBP domain-containing protein [Rhodococcus baikonurensis]|uniref:FBP domain-containing protein n=1 Tax=Rhodococcus baikonurensis TaxID=172041 RepID=UPI0037BDF57F